MEFFIGYILAVVAYAISNIMQKTEKKDYYSDENVIKRCRDIHKADETYIKFYERSRKG